MIRYTLIFLMVVGISSVNAAEDVPLDLDIKDWIIGCDNTRECTAIGAVPIRDDIGIMTFSLRVTRKAGPQGTLRVGVFSYNAPRGQPTLDGKPIKNRFGPGELKEGDVPEVFALTGTDAKSLIEELRNGQELILPIEGGTSVASLNGMSASLLLMDSVQGRVGTQDALIAKGQVPGSSVPQPPAAPPLPSWYTPAALTQGRAKEIADAVIAATRKDWQGDLVEGTPPKAETFALSEDQALVIIETSCGAYNCAYSIYQTPLNHPEQARTAQIAEVPRFPYMLPHGYVEFNPTTGELSSYTLAMGMGGCGTSLRWRYNGNSFTLLRAAQMNTCMGLDQAYWPVLWRTKSSLEEQ
ncbi:DUF1176 domain-containing protein [Pectobacterium parmentieri]|uniref:DUF1176 domain-containing protein n=1 Tax=Pectobacterium parmentieri TaxID=1905730 RepID=A0A8B3FV89_PECPM|nr:DUF1176 domain-containing protein [Pectobacterium parmentieri]AYH18933.1 DUF1176 domain-containing protein [Pectobacterium parmentieri]AYH36637.1 DUF1176 domain-containing protein [Pectobacterium parmentieri]AZS56856.1 DUF1176 domain-containing protein [Pectobacterium parmentieri]MBI0429618.1 DUF1176 domain-containing protein [Pectobacterium parmentieri]RKO76373.1 DUF1176 domain-containing protein [Pectobacterium parmentieri]